MKLLHPELSEKIEACFKRVYEKLGYGFLERLYEKALCLEFEKHAIRHSLKPKLDVFYEGTFLGTFYPDVLIDEKIILEIKSIEVLKSVHEVQLLNYLSATRLQVGYLVNFGPQLEVLRRVFTNDRKQLLGRGQVCAFRNSSREQI